jgi:DNA (cytosine-5)-methyltransferase 1
MDIIARATEVALFFSPYREPLLTDPTNRKADRTPFGFNGNRDSKERSRKKTSQTYGLAEPRLRNYGIKQQASLTRPIYSVPPSLGSAEPVPPVKFFPPTIIIIMAPDPIFIIVDLFCGFGGTTSGFVKACIHGQRIAEVIACVNHDPKAIRSHWLNNPTVKHFNEDIRTLDLRELTALVAAYRARYPNAQLILWASLECTNFSKAKGGKSRDADSRTLANHLERYIMALRPDYIQVENVVEFMAWGPLKVKEVKTREGYTACPVHLVEDAKGRMRIVCDMVPESMKNGQYWLKWRKKICSLGYRDEWRQLNSADYGAYTSRNRLFGVFARKGAPIAWPEPTHSRNPSGKVAKEGIKPPSLFSEYNGGNSLRRWKAVKEVLDFTDEGESIFLRKKALSDNTLERIYAGLLKYIAKGNKAFISKYFSGQPSSKNIPVNGPAATIKTKDGQSLVQAAFATKIDAGATTPGDSASQAPFLMHYYSNGGQTSAVTGPCSTITAMDGKALIQPKHFLERQFGKSQNQSIDRPAGTIVTNDKHRLITTESLINPAAATEGLHSIDATSPGPEPGGIHHYLINPSWGGHVGSTEEPCCVLVARQDKAPLYVVQAEKGAVQIAVYPDDSPAMIKIKHFMAAFDLVDIKMRMLRVPELLRIQGFPDTYQMVGSQADHKKFIGNSVVPDVVKAWAEALAHRIPAQVPTLA